MDPADPQHPVDPDRDLEALLEVLPEALGEALAAGRRPGDPVVLVGKGEESILEESVLETVRRLEAGEAADDAVLRSVLAEVAEALAEALADADEIAGADGGPPAQDVRAAAIEAYGVVRPARPALPVVEPAGAHDRSPPGRPGVRTEPLRALRPRRASSFPLQAAALVLIGLGAALWVGVSGSPTAQASIHLGAVHRVDLARGRPELSSGRRLSAGERIVSGADEVVGLRLIDGSTVALDGEGTLEVSTTDGDRAVLKLLDGQACVSAGLAGATLALRDGTLLLVDYGSAWLGTAPVAVALATGSRGWVIRPDGARTEIAGPLKVPLEDGASRPVAPEPGLFRSLALFRPTPTMPHAGSLVDAGRWRVSEGRTRRMTNRLRVVPGGASRTARVAWRPSSSLRDALRIDVLLDAPEGTRISLPAFGLVGTVGEAPISATPGRHVIALRLPRDWFARLGEGGEEIEIEILWPEGRDEAVLFEGARFLFGGSGEEKTRG